MDESPYNKASREILRLSRCCFHGLGWRSSNSFSPFRSLILEASYYLFCRKASYLQKRRKQDSSISISFFLPLWFK